MLCESEFYARVQLCSSSCKSARVQLQSRLSACSQSGCVLLAGSLPEHYSCAAGITGLVFYATWAGVPILIIAWVGCTVQKRIPNVLSLSDYALRVSSCSACKQWLQGPPQGADTWPAAALWLAGAAVGQRSHAVQHGAPLVWQILPV